MQVGARAALGKYVAIERLNWGLMLLVVLTAGMLVVVMFRAFVGQQAS